MQKISAILFLLIVLRSCEPPNLFVESRLKTAEKFVECLVKNQSDKILDFSDAHVDYNISDKESRDFYVKKASTFINHFGLPPTSKWIVKHDLQNNFERLVITIPIFKGYDSTFNLLQADIVLVFPPPQIGDKIYKFDVADQYDFSKMGPILAPQ